MPTTNYFDVILVGGDLAGLAAAALLSHRGFRVLRLAGDDPPDSYKLGRHALPTSPLAFTGLESPATRRIVSALNLIQLLRRRLSPQRPHFQVVLPDARIDVGDGAERDPRELARELGEDAVRAFDAYLGRAQEIGRIFDAVLAQDSPLVPESFWERRELGRWELKLAEASRDLWAGIPEDHPLRIVATLPAALGSTLSPVAPSALAIARHDELARRGTFRLEGGMAALRALVAERITGETRAEGAARIVLRRGRVVGVETSARGELGTNYVLYAGPLARLPALLYEGENIPKRMAERLAGARPAGYRYVLNAVVTARGIPEGIASLVLAAFAPGAPLVGPNALAFHVGEPDEEGHVLVSATCVVPAPGGSAGDGDRGADDAADTVALARAARPAVEARLAALMPFWEGHRVLLHSPHDGLPAAGMAVDAPPPVPMEPVYASEEPAPLGVGMVPHRGLAKHLVLASRQNLPGLGLEGELAAAWGAARLIAASEHKKDFLRSETLLSRA